jgi:hypothetical protein
VQSDADPVMWILHGENRTVLVMFYLENGLVAALTDVEARVSAFSCKASHCGQSCAPPGPSNGPNSMGPCRLASWVVAIAERYATSPSSRQVCARPKPRWRSGRVNWSVGPAP